MPACITIFRLGPLPLLLHPHHNGQGELLGRNELITLVVADIGNLGKRE